MYIFLKIHTEIKDIPSLFALWARQEEFSLYYISDVDRNEGSYFTAEVYYDEEAMASGYMSVVVHIEPIDEKLYLHTRASIDISELASFREGWDYASLHSFNLTGDQSLVETYAQVAFMPEINKPFTGCTWVQDLGFTRHEDYLPQEAENALRDWISKEQWLRISYKDGYSTVNEYMLVPILPLSAHPGWAKEE